MHFLLTKKLKYFMALMETRCLTKASEDLFITRSPLGKTINELEKMLGEKLFYREHGMYKPTKFALELYEQAQPVYKKIVHLEEYFIKSETSSHVNVILDSSFPDNIADVLLSSLNKSDFLLHVTRQKIYQEELDNFTHGPDVLIISHHDLVADTKLDCSSYYSSTLLLVTNKKLKQDPGGLEKIPLLMRSNMSDSATGRLTAILQRVLGFIPKIRYVNDNVFDCLLMAGNGKGGILLPLKTCELLNISREHTFLLEDLKLKVNYFYRKSSKNKKEITKIINYINTLF